MPPYSTSADTRSGCDAAKTTLIGTPSESPNSAARCDPAASITARMSSERSSRVAIFLTRSERPVPRLSNTITRLNDAIRSRNAANRGCCHISSTWEAEPGVNTRSTGPSPAMA